VFPYISSSVEEGEMMFLFAPPPPPPGVSSSKTDTEEGSQALDHLNTGWEPSPWGRDGEGQQPSMHDQEGCNSMDKKVCAISKIDVFLVPGLAFDRAGRRLGRGGGHYDKALAEARGLKIGLAGSHQISNEALPEESHDVRMDAVVTERFSFFPLSHSRFFQGVL